MRIRDPARSATENDEMIKGGAGWEHGRNYSFIIKTFLERKVAPRHPHRGRDTVLLGMHRQARRQKFVRESQRNSRSAENSFVSSREALL